MKKFRLRQEIDITEEDGTPLKTVSIDMWVSTEGISEEIINNMFKSLSDEFTRIIDEVNTDGERPEKIEFMSDDIRKRW